MNIKSPLYLAISFASYTLFNPLQAENLSLDSTIRQVMVYPNSAMITRIARISIPAGEHSISLTGLPLGLSESSLRVTGQSVADVQLGSVELQKNINREAVQQSERKLQNKIEEANEQKRVLRDSLQQNKDQLGYIRAMASGSTANDNRIHSSSYLQLPVEKWDQAWQTLANATAVTQEKIRNAQKQIKQLDKTIQQLRQQLNQVATHQRTNRTAVLDIQTDTATELELKLRYQIQGAHWRPVYDADLDTKTGKIQLKSLAQISQRTGEDWHNVEVHLSTLRPSASSQLPILNPWVIDFMPERLNYYKSGGASPKYELSKELDESVSEGEVMFQAMPAPAAPLLKKKVMRPRSSTVAIADFSAEYKVPTKVSLNSGSDKRRVILQSQTLDAKVSLASVPRLDPRAMLVATTQYKGEIPLLAGTVVLHRDGNFIGNTYLSMLQTGEEMKLSFGEDDKVKIKFIPDPDKKGQDGLFFGKRKTVKRNYHFSVTNQHDKTYEINFSDSIPVAANEAIKVILKGDKPTRIDENNKKGILVWERQLIPQKTITLEYGYEVTYPEDKTVTGL